VCFSRSFTWSTARASISCNFIDVVNCDEVRSLVNLGDSMPASNLNAKGNVRIVVFTAVSAQDYILLSCDTALSCDGHRISKEHAAQIFRVEVR
jgi:hypothetical protein